MASYTEYIHSLSNNAKQLQTNSIMKNLLSITLRLTCGALILISIASMQGCGQKGPLEIERPQVVQEEENEQTK